mmetsp:Transcript_21030/g.39894  ORF Transcript_21030/g.39894 Transcript_21030/m.39894 type:complete len:355 (+) Transcript_21030:251-1315(+)
MIRIDVTLRVFLQILQFGLVISFILSRNSLKNNIFPRSLPHTSHPNRLHGLPEWRAKFAFIPTNSSAPKQTTLPPSNNTLPLLLFPFTPSQVILPGQSAKLTFRHGKFMDMIDDSITSYESVVGLSVLDEDGLLPVVVVCEVLEEELVINPGFRGVVSMEVGLRAVGRARRCDYATERCDGGGSIGGSTFGRTALDDIHLGSFVEWHDDEMDETSFKSSKDYVRSIELLLSPSGKENAKKFNAAGSPMRQRESRYFEAYYNMLDCVTLLDSSMLPESEVIRRRNEELVAASWAAFSSVDSGSISPSFVTEALLTQDTAERLRLGMILVLESAAEVLQRDVYCGAADIDGEDTFQ